jgi:4-hydroxy-tetrahydrodipicolinate synthase
MTEKRLTGSFVALITPMNHDYSVDFEGFKVLVDFQAENGTAAVLLMGSSGEVSMLTPEERHAIVERTIGYRPDGVEMWYGATGATTEATIGYARQAAECGADGVIVAAPPYITADNESIVQYFLDVAEASQVPIGIYNNPPRVKTDLGPEDILRVAAHLNVTVIKESTKRSGQVAEVARAKPTVSLMCCCSPGLGLIVPTMSLGGHGTANVTGNMIPAEMAEISTPWTDPQVAMRFQDSYLRYLPMLKFAYSEVNPVPTKSFLDAVGMPAGPLRRPLRPVSREALETALRFARELGLDQKYGFDLS